MTIIAETMLSLSGFMFIGSLNGAYFVNSFPSSTELSIVPTIGWPNPNVPSAETIEETQSAGDGSYTGVDFSQCPQDTVAWQIYPGFAELQSFFQTIAGNGSQANPFQITATFLGTRQYAHIPPDFTVIYDKHFVTHTYTNAIFTAGASGLGVPVVYGPFLWSYGDPPIQEELVAASFDRNLTDYFNNA